MTQDHGLQGQSFAGKRASQQPLAQKAYHHIKQQILTCQLFPGDMVAGSQLAEALGMSRTPIHEALKLLVNEGLLQVLTRVGYVVTPVTLTDVQDVFQLRLTLEPLGAELAASRVTRAELDAFKSMEREFEEQADGLSENSPEFDVLAIAAHRNFHVMVATLSGNRQLADIVRGLLDQSQRMLMLDPHGTVEVNFMKTTQHRRIFAALEARDGQAARKAATTHIRQAHERVVGSLRAQPSIAELPHDLVTR